MHTTQNVAISNHDRVWVCGIAIGYPYIRFSGLLQTTGVYLGAPKDFGVPLLVPKIWDAPGISGHSPEYAPIPDPICRMQRRELER